LQVVVSYALVGLGALVYTSIFAAVRDGSLDTAQYRVLAVDGASDGRDEALGHSSDTVRMVSLQPATAHASAPPQDLFGQGQEQQRVGESALPNTNGVNSNPM
jgi:hypothetical protein